MKIQLLQEKSYPVLVVQGEVSSQEVLILRAGLSKLLKNGKNRIILEFTEASKLSQEVLREIAVFNVLARELAGNIVIAGVDPATKARIETYSKPPVVECFVTRFDAAAALAPVAPTDSPPPGTPGPQPAAPTKADASAGAKSGALKELESQNQLRSELEKLKSRNAELEEQLRVLVITRRDLPDAEAYKDRLRSLEAELLDVNERLRVASEKK